MITSLYEAHYHLKILELVASVEFLSDKQKGREGMKRNRSFSLLFFLSLLVIIFVTFSTVSVEARKKNLHKRNNHKDGHSGNGHGRGSHSPRPTPTPPPYYGSQGSMFDVLSFGAKGNGVSDDSEVNKFIKAC